MRLNYTFGEYPMKRLFLILALLAIPWTTPWADEAQEETRPKIGLALSGGGARGGAHIGVLEALEELKVPVDYIAGTSMGAIVGALYASGYEAGEIRRILGEMDWTRAMSDRPDRRDRTMRRKELEAEFLIPYRVGFNGGEFQFPLGAIDGQHLDQVFNELLMPVMGVTDFDQLPIPFRAIATDLANGEEVILGKGNLTNSLRASMSVPGVFAPVRIEDRLLVDGGMSNNLPVSVVRAMGADIVIAVDISSPFLTEDQLTSVLSVTEQLTNFLTRRTTRQQIGLLGPQDLLVVPDLEGFSSADFERAHKIIQKGYKAAMAASGYLEGLSGRGGEVQSDGTAPVAGDFVVQFIELENPSVLHDEIIRSRVDVEIGQPVDLERLNRSVDRIYSLDLFSSVTYDLVTREDGEQGVVVHAIPRSWGPNYLQFGLELSSDFAGNSDYKLGVAYTRNALNALGGELRIIASMGREDELSFDFYQPVDTEARWFIQPGLQWARENYAIWGGGNQYLAELELAGWSARFGLGRNFTTTDRVALNYQFSRADADVLIGDPGFLTDDSVDIGEFRLEYIHDNLDAVWFPTSGMRHHLEYLYADEALGASANFTQAVADGSMILSHGRNTALLNYEIGYSFGDEAPIERWFRLGGFGRMSGLAPDQLLGRHIALATIAYYRRLNNLDLLPVYAGLTLEAGNVWLESDDISQYDPSYSGSVFVGADTPLGPIYAAYGHNVDLGGAFYFYVGNPFRVKRFD
jgi:NTE family protein